MHLASYEAGRWFVPLSPFYKLSYVSTSCTNVYFRNRLLCLLVSVLVFLSQKHFVAVKLVGVSVHRDDNAHNHLCGLIDPLEPTEAL